MRYALFTPIAIVITMTIGLLLYRQAFAPTESLLPVKTVSEVDEIEIIATDLSVPWEIRSLPSGKLLLTERTGNLVQINHTGEIFRLDIETVSANGEGGLLGLALHPEFEQNNWLYLYRTVASTSGMTNQVVRYTYNSDNHTVSDETVILAEIPGARFHDGGRLEFGPDGYLYITTGDAGIPALAQDINSYAGKILRIKADGGIPDSNPFQSAVYSYGHRNPQGLTWDTAGNLWSTEHGRSGLQSGFDELNTIEAGANYGWSTAEGDITKEGFRLPIIHSGSAETWAPASLTSSNKYLYFAGLRGQRLYQADITTNPITLTTFLVKEYGRLRTARVIGDYLYLTTSNTDGRGNANTDDDILLSVPLSLLE